MARGGSRLVEEDGRRRMRWKEWVL
jgi:hypothetical protein